jgi:hypothetical protein
MSCIDSYTYENTVHLLHSLERIQILQKILHQRIPARASGYTTTTDILEIQQALDTTKWERDFYAGRERHKLSPTLAAALNSVEKAHLKDKESLGGIAEKSSRNLSIQNVFIERAKQFPAWSDNLAVDLFAGRRKEFFDLERNYFGVKVEVPLYWDDRKNDLIKLQQRIYRFQKNAVFRRISQNIDKLTAYFNFYQQKIESSVDELSLSRSRIPTPVIDQSEVLYTLPSTWTSKGISTRCDFLG